MGEGFSGPEVIRHVQGTQSRSFCLDNVEYPGKRGKR